MLLSEQTITVKASPRAAWDKLIDWQKMHEWDIFMDHVSFDGPITIGSVGQLQLKRGPQVAIKVTSFDPPRAYTDEISVAGSKLVFHHEVEAAPAGEALVRIRIEGHGLLVFFMRATFKRGFKAQMPTLMNNFKDQLESRKG